MKKVTAILLTFILGIQLFICSTSAESINTDPNYDFHLQISKHIDELRELRNKKIAPIQEKLESFQKQSLELYKSKSEYTENMQETYNTISENIAIQEKAISDIKMEYFNDIDEYLMNMGFDIIDETQQIDYFDKLIHTSATDAGKMQTTSKVSYNASKKEFYYFVEYDYTGKNLFGAYVGLNDEWGTYDLVSMQHRDEKNWYWNNIIVTANLPKDLYGNSLVGKADKYKIIDKGIGGTSAVSNREDLWNGCIFNIKDAEVKTPYFNSEIRFVTLEGWLRVSGSTKTTQVKSEYEHNYKTDTKSVSINASTLNNGTFGMTVNYSATIGKWRRSAGSRTCTVS